MKIYNRKKFMIDGHTRNELETLASICKSNLKNSPECLSYLKDTRGLSDSIISKYGIGYFPQNVSMITKFVSRAVLERLNIINFSGNSKFSDFYYLVFPIKNEYGQIVGFNGRTLVSEDQREILGIPKYENSSFKKSEVLFGFSSARGAILNHQKVFITEGNFDQISLDQANIRNSVAICGTAFSKNHFLRLAKYTKEMVFVLDRDDGGERAMENIAKKFSNKGVTMSFKSIPKPYNDVDDFFGAGNSKEDFLESLEDFSVDSEITWV